jgi:hypothetical protein
MAKRLNRKRSPVKRKPKARARREIAKAQKVTLAIRADDQDGLVVAFDRKVLSAIFGSSKSSKSATLGGAGDFADGLRMAVQQLAPALMNAANVSAAAGYVDSAAAAETEHATNAARFHEYAREQGCKHCPRCGASLEPS